jgi:adenine-specific DNA-methyltransferase
MSEIINKLDIRSMNISQDKKNKLKELFPEVFSEDKIDFDKLKLTLGEELADSEERFGLQWPGKKDCFKIIQAPSIGTLKPLKDESVNWDKTQNVYIEGDNLEVLKLLQKSYYGKIKMIYIDPPYNTGGEFIYPDRFQENLDAYLTYTGQLNDEGKKFSTNSETSGRFHSNWLNMMYPRLFLARNLMKNDGVIFISIDDNEYDNLKKICNEIFGEENFVSSVVWKRKRGRDNSAKFVSKSHEYLLIYAKNINNLKFNKLELDEETLKAYKNTDKDARGPYRTLGVWARGTQGGSKYSYINNNGVHFDERLWLMKEENLRNLENENKLIFNGDKVYRKLFLNENDGNVSDSLWDDISNAANAADEIKKIFGEIIFDTPKPIPYLTKMLKMATENNDIILDFFSGSSSMAHAILEINKNESTNRKFIMVQLPELLEQKSNATNLGFKTIADIGKDRIRRVINKIEKEINEEKNNQNFNPDLGFKVFKLDNSNFNKWEGNTEKYNLENQLEKALFHIDTNSTKEDLLTEIILNSGFDLTVDIKTEIISNKEVYLIENDSLFICLENDLNEILIKEIANLKPTSVVFLDSGFNQNDELKANATQIFKSYGVENFRTI